MNAPPPRTSPPPPELAPSLPPIESIPIISVRAPAAGEVVPHALSVPPGTQVTVPGAAPPWWAHALAVTPDVFTIALFGFLIAHGTMTPAAGGGLILAVLTARLNPVKLGDSARSGVLTILTGVLNARNLPPPPPPPMTPPTDGGER